MHNVEREEAKQLNQEMCITEDFIRSNLERNIYLSLFITNEVACNKWRRLREFVCMAQDKGSL